MGDGQRKSWRVGIPFLERQRRDGLEQAAEPLHLFAVHQRPAFDGMLEPTQKRREVVGDLLEPVQDVVEPIAGGTRIVRE